MMSLIQQNLILRNLVKLLDVGDDNCNDEVNHCNTAEDDEEDKKNHGEDSAHSTASSTARIFPKIVKLKLSQDHNEGLDEAFADVVKVFCFIIEVNYVESESECTDEDDESEGCSNYPFRD